MKTQSGLDWLPTFGSGGISATSTAGTTYSGQALTNIIHFANGIRQLTWDIELLNNDLTHKGWITPFVSSFTITHDNTQQIKRTMTLNLLETVASETLIIIQQGQQLLVTSAGINYTFDAVRPWCCIRAPDGGWLRVPVGTFFFQKSGVTMPGFAVIRRCELADITYLVSQTVALTQEGTALPLTLPASTALLGIPSIAYSLLVNNPTNTPTVPASLNNLPGCALSTLIGSSWPGTGPDATSPPSGLPYSEGTTYLEIVNKLLFYVNYYDLWVDSMGRLQVTAWPPNQDYTSELSEWTYDTTANSIIAVGGTEDFAMDQLYNTVEVVVEDASTKIPYYAVATIDGKLQHGSYVGGVWTPNQSYVPTSPIDVSNLGRRITQVISDSGVPQVTSQDWAEAYAKKQLLLNSYLMDQVQLPIAVNPFHEHLDVITLNVYQYFVAAGSPQNQAIIIAENMPGLVLTEKFLVTGWQINAQLAALGGGQDPQGGAGMTTTLTPRDTMQGSSMTLTAHRITSLAPISDIYVYHFQTS